MSDSSSPDVTGVPSQPAAPEPTNSFQRIAGVLFAPAQTFPGIVRKPDFLIPLVLIILVSTFFGIVAAKRVDFAAPIRDMYDRPDAPKVSADIQEKQIRLTSSFGRMGMYVSPVFGVITMAVVAGILLIVFRLFGGEGNYASAFSVSMYAYIPMVISALLGGLILLGRHDVPSTELPGLVRSSLGFLIDQKAHPMAFALLSSIDLLSFWSLALYTIGFAAMAQMKRSRAAAIIISLWAVLVVLKLGGAAMQSLGMKH